MYEEKVGFIRDLIFTGPTHNAYLNSTAIEGEMRNVFCI
jgi:hypothetical protein